MAEQYKSEALAAVHETALGLHEAGVMEALARSLGQAPDARCQEGTASGGVSKRI
jgi:hypothetical protein